MHYEIVLATANARFSHPAFGLRWLWANLGALKESAVIVESTISDPADKIAGDILEHYPQIVAFGVYIWNVSLLTDVARRIKDAHPEIVVVIGGPEVSYEYEGTPLCELADYLICGEGEWAFRALAQDILSGERPMQKVIESRVADLASLVLPYDSYSDFDLAKRLVYVEASRGCPFQCAFCLSSLDRHVREFPLEPFLLEMGRLIERGAKRFKFVDRTFNLCADRVEAILRLFLDKWRDGLQVHFEIVPDRLDEQMLAGMARFPESGLRLEVGIQTLNAESQHAIRRRQDTEKSLRNLRRLVEMGAVVHADLVAGLPYETWESFSHGFDEIIALRPYELQMGILKRLKGTAIAERAEILGLRFSSEPPYEIIETQWMNAQELEKVKRFARYFDLVYNSHNFTRAVEWLLKIDVAPFNSFLEFSETVWAETGRKHGLPLVEQAKLLFIYLTKKLPERREEIASDIESDFRRIPGRKDKLEFLR